MNIQQDSRMRNISVDSDLYFYAACFSTKRVVLDNLLLEDIS